MTPPVVIRPILTITSRPVAVTKAQAAELLSVSIDSLERHVLPDLRVIRRGRLVLIPVAELERWCEAAAERTLNNGNRERESET
ncbi:MAG: hypothetical protein WKF96_16210 [Solirubrobacteraceae bacterium]